MASSLSGLLAKVTQSRFAQARDGAVAIIFGLAAFPVFGATGVAIDYSRTNSVKSELQAAVDSAALGVARDGSRLSRNQMDQKAREFFTANFARSSRSTVSRLDIRIANETVTVEACANVPTAMMGIVGIQTMNTCAESTANWSTPTIELALALDNTGSMGWSGKMDELKRAVHSLLTTLQTQARDPSRVKVSIVPFDVQMNVGTTHRNAGYMRFDNAGLAPDMQTSQAAWTGCVTDRDQPFDVSDAVPTGGANAWRPSACTYGSLAPVMPLTNDFNALRARVDAMRPNGYTNVTMGFTGGMATLTPGSPFPGAGALGNPNVVKILIVLTDGDNTRNRFTWNWQDIDARTRSACTTIRNRPITVYTIRVIDGNANLLRDCATSPAHFFDVRNANQLTPVFQNIARQILTVRLTS
jgi:Flp pilus assembly protein TadG